MFIFIAHNVVRAAIHCHQISAKNCLAPALRSARLLSCIFLFCPVCAVARIRVYVCLCMCASETEPLLLFIFVMLVSFASHSVHGCVSCAVRRDPASLCQATAHNFVNICCCCWCCCCHPSQTLTHTHTSHDAYVTYPSVVCVRNIFFISATFFLHSYGCCCLIFTSFLACRLIIYVISRLILFCLFRFGAL